LQALAVCRVSPEDALPNLEFRASQSSGPPAPPRTYALRAAARRHRLAHGCVFFEFRPLCPHARAPMDFLDRRPARPGRATSTRSSFVNHPTCASTYDLQSDEDREIEHPLAQADPSALRCADPPSRQCTRLMKVSENSDKKGRPGRGPRQLPASARRARVSLKMVPLINAAQLRCAHLPLSY